MLLFLPKVEFLTPDNGEMNSNGFGLPQPVEALDQSPPVVNMFYGISNGSWRSLASTQTCVPIGVLDLTLEEVCKYIDAHNITVRRRTDLKLGFWKQCSQSSTRSFVPKSRFKRLDPVYSFTGVAHSGHIVSLQYTRWNQWRWSSWDSLEREDTWHSGASWILVCMNIGAPITTT